MDFHVENAARITRMILLTVVLLAATGAGNTDPPAHPAITAYGMNVVDATDCSPRKSMPEMPRNGGTCYLYPEYIVIAWGSPELGEPVAIARKRGSGEPNLDPDAQPGDFVVLNEWAEYFAGMWDDRLLIDSGTSNMRALYVYDLLSRSQLGLIQGMDEVEEWIDEYTMKVWMMTGSNLPRSMCPEIPEGFVVGVDSLYSLDIRTLSLQALGPWRCRAMQ